MKIITATHTFILLMLFSACNNIVQKESKTRDRSTSNFRRQYSARNPSQTN